MICIGITEQRWNWKYSKEIKKSRRQIFLTKEGIRGPNRGVIIC